jgi:hypothetical protein
VTSNIKLPLYPISEAYFIGLMFSPEIIDEYSENTKEIDNAKGD